MADTVNDIFKLGEKLYKEITKVNKKWKSHLLNCRDIIIVRNYKLTGYIKILVPLLPVRLKPNLVATLLQTLPSSLASKATKKLKVDSH